MGNIPFFVIVLKDVPPERKRRLLVRELLIALAVLVFFLLLGPQFLAMMRISGPSIRIAGGIVLLFIAIKMVFPTTAGSEHDLPYCEPLIVPLAIPYLAGPSAMATVMLFGSNEPGRWPEWLAAVACAWLVSAVVLLFCVELERLLGQRGMLALQRLMGMLLTAIAVEMTLGGIMAFIAAAQTGKG